MTESSAGGNRLTTIILSLIALLLLVIVIQNIRMPVLEPSTGYHAVTLSNGQTFFGRLNGLNDAFAEMSDVHLLQRRADPNSGQVRTILIKRRGVLHAPVRSKINRDAIVVVEPVHPNSPLAQLLAELAERDLNMIDVQGDVVPSKEQ